MLLLYSGLASAQARPELYLRVHGGIISMAKFTRIAIFYCGPYTDNKLRQVNTYRELSADNVSNSLLETATKSLQSLNAFWLPDIDILGNESRNLLAECHIKGEIIFGTQRIPLLAFN